MKLFFFFGVHPIQWTPELHKAVVTQVNFVDLELKFCHSTETNPTFTWTKTNYKDTNKESNYKKQQQFDFMNMNTCYKEINIWNSAFIPHFCLALKRKKEINQNFAFMWTALKKKQESILEHEIMKCFTHIYFLNVAFLFEFSFTFISISL